MCVQGRLHDLQSSPNNVVVNTGGGLNGWNMLARTVLVILKLEDGISFCDRARVLIYILKNQLFALK